MYELRELRVWQDAHEITLQVYQLTAGYPGHELYGLVSQMRRAAVSIGSNIAEGKGKGSKNEFTRFLRIVKGSLTELQYQLLLSKDLDYITDKEHVTLDRQVQALKGKLNRLIKSLN